MSIGIILEGMLIAFGFVFWPIVGAYSQTTSAWIGTIAMASTACMAAILAGKQLYVIPPAKALAILIFAGAINGVAIHRYAYRMTQSNMSTSTFVAFISVMMVVIAPFLDWKMNGVVPGLYKLIGFGFAVLAIIFLTIFE